tara:strand:+ start:5586 stop:5855 length:270 start_codon:yes stop_codon:yes gene_type:complete
MSILTLQLKARIIRKLVQSRKWNENSENIIAGLPAHWRQEPIVEKALKELENYNWLLKHETEDGTYYSLNKNKVLEILNFYERYCENKS